MILMDLKIIIINIIVKIIVEMIVKHLQTCYIMLVMTIDNVSYIKHVDKMVNIEKLWM